MSTDSIKVKSKKMSKSVNNYSEEKSNSSNSLERLKPILTNINEENDVMSFTLSNVDVSIANSIRRVILSEIDCIIFKTTPYEENNCIIYSNTSRLNNEILKHRLSCIPIHISDITFPFKDYILEIKEKNNSDTIKLITTNDFKIKNIKTNTFLSQKEVNQILPPDKISKHFIEFLRLRPKLADNIEGEEIHLECKLDISNAKQNSAYNVVSCCAYGNTPDSLIINKEWEEKEKQLINEKYNQDDIEFIKKDWLLLDAARYYKNNSFDFIIESLGVFDNIQIIKNACFIMLKKLDTFLENIKLKNNLIVPINNTIANCYEIVLENEDYTLGKVLEFLLYKNYYEADSETKLNYCGFRKPHPHINISIIRIGFKNTNYQSSDFIILINDMILNIVNQAKFIYNEISNSL